MKQMDYLTVQSYLMNVELYSVFFCLYKDTGGEWFHSSMLQIYPWNSQRFHRPVTRLNKPFICIKMLRVEGAYEWRIIKQSTNLRL